MHEDASKTIALIKQLDEQGNIVKELEPRNIYFGGDAKTWQILKYCVRYPGTASENNIQGLVIIEAKLNKQGKLTDERAISTNGYGYLSTELQPSPIMMLKLTKLKSPLADSSLVT